MTGHLRSELSGWCSLLLNRTAFRKCPGSRNVGEGWGIEHAESRGFERNAGDVGDRFRPTESKAATTRGMIVGGGRCPAYRIAPTIMPCAVSRSQATKLGRMTRKATRGAPGMFLMEA